MEGLFNAANASGASQRSGAMPAAQRKCLAYTARMPRRQNIGFILIMSVFHFEIMPQAG
ncbi:hypothetical protein [Vineibacter terrae]|uniref:hypothetical protein n=1 Tax=Vineibacter terrae TaxID=2586908 RepID=UPI0015B4FEFF|nr:hypothetical protein [Vineibacter terrae]